jgi:hypothetical protein
MHLLDIKIRYLLLIIGISFGIAPKPHFFSLIQVGPASRLVAARTGLKRAYTGNQGTINLPRIKVQWIVSDRAFPLYCYL